MPHSEILKCQINLPLVNIVKFIRELAEWIEQIPLVEDRNHSGMRFSNPAFRIWKEKQQTVSQSISTAIFSDKLSQ